MFRAKSNADDASRYPAQTRKAANESKQEWNLERLGAREHSPDCAVLNDDLKSLRGASGKHPASLHGFKIRFTDAARGQLCRKNIGSGDRILDGKIDSDATCRGHGVCRVANAKQSLAAPIAQTIDLDGKQFDLGPVVQLSYPVAKEPGKTDDIVLKLRQTACFDLVKAALRNDTASLPIIIAVE